MARVLVLGGTGDQGWPLLQRLIAAGHEVRAASRRPVDFEWSRFHGVIPVAADPGDGASLRQAASGAEAILAHLPFTFERGFARRMGENIGAAAREAGAKIVFHTSCYVADRDIGSDGHDGRRDIEAAIAASGASYAFVRSTVFMDNLVRDWARPSIVRHGIFAYPAGPTLRISWVCHDDIAAAMVAAWQDGERAARYLVGGPEALTGDEVAARLSRALGRRIQFQSLSPEQFAAAMSKLVTGNEEYEPGGLYDRMAEMYRWYNAQDVSPLAADLRPVLGRLAYRPTPFLVWAADQDWRD